MGTAREETHTYPKPAVIRRRFRLFDAMILVAATAIGCGLQVWLDRATDGGVSMWSVCKDAVAFLSGTDVENRTEAMIYLGAMIAGVMSPIVATWTLAYTDPAGRAATAWNRLGYQPGIVVALASILRREVYFRLSSLR